MSLFAKFTSLMTLLKEFDQNYHVEKREGFYAQVPERKFQNAQK